MNSFVGQDGSIKFHYRTYGVDEVAPFSPEPRIRPNSRIYLLAQGETKVENHRGNWGMNTGRFDWNARDDRLEESPLWRQLWLHPGHHIVLPASRVYEATTRHGPRQFHAINRIDDQPLWIAGLGKVMQGKYRTEWHTTMVTVDAGPVFKQVHDEPREVAVLRDWDEVQRWLSAGDEKAMRKLLRAADETLLENYRVHDDVLKPAFPEEKCAEPWTPGPAESGATRQKRLS